MEHYQCDIELRTNYLVHPSCISCKLLTVRHLKTLHLNIHLCVYYIHIILKIYTVHNYNQRILDFPMIKQVIDTLYQNT